RQQHPGDRQALALTAGESVPALADDRVETIGQGVDDARQLGSIDRVAHLLLGRTGMDDSGVSADGLVADVAALRDHAAGRAMIGGASGANRGGAKRDRPAGAGGGGRQQRVARGRASPRGDDGGEGGTGGNRQAPVWATWRSPWQSGWGRARPPPRARVIPRS